MEIQHHMVGPGSALSDDIVLSQLVRRGVFWDDWSGVSERFGALRLRLFDAGLCDPDDEMVSISGASAPGEVAEVLSSVAHGCTQNRMWAAFQEPRGVAYSRLLGPNRPPSLALSPHNRRELVVRTTYLLDAIEKGEPIGVIPMEDLILSREGRVRLFAGCASKVLLSLRGASPWMSEGHVAPELRIPGTAPTRACDVYSIGATLLSLLMDRVPSRAALRVTLEQVAADFGATVGRALRAMLATDPRKRPESGAEVRAMLGRWMEHASDDSGRSVAPMPQGRILRPDEPTPAYSDSVPNARAEAPTPSLTPEAVASMYREYGLDAEMPPGGRTYRHGNGGRCLGQQRLRRSRRRTDRRRVAPRIPGTDECFEVRRVVRSKLRRC